MHSEIAGKYIVQTYGSDQRIVLILDTTSDLPESVCKILVENWLHLQAVCANCIWQSEPHKLFARIDRANSSRQCETALFCNLSLTSWLCV